MPRLLHSALLQGTDVGAVGKKMSYEPIAQGITYARGNVAYFVVSGRYRR